MPMFRIDEDAHKKLQEIKEEMKKQGIAAPANSDVIRFLYSKYKTENLHKRKYQSFSDIVDETINDKIKQQLEICVREYHDPNKDFYGFFMVGEGTGLFSPRFYSKKEMLEKLIKEIDKNID